MTQIIEVSTKLANSLTPILLDKMNEIYASEANLEQIDLYDETAEDIEGVIFHKKMMLKEHDFFKIYHSYTGSPNKDQISFERFDMDIDLYTNNVLKFAAIYSNNAKFHVDTRLYFLKVYKSLLMNKLFRPTIDSENIKIELKLHFKDASDFSILSWRKMGILCLSCSQVDGKMIINNKEEVFSFFNNFFSLARKQFDIPDDINLDYTQASGLFDDNLLLLNMAVI
jgi:hypothetical protein